MNTTSSTENYSSTPYYGNNTAAKSKYRPYRNRPSKRQAILEGLSFLILLAAGPVFLGGVLSIFICIAAFALGIIGLFAWTRRHVALFSLLATLILLALITNIILRSLFVGQCLPYFYYAGNDRFGGAAFAPIVAVPTNNTIVPPVNTTVPIPPVNTTVPVPPTANITANGTNGLRQSNNGNNNNNGSNNDNSYNGNNFNNSIWCGNRAVVYVTNAILILLLIPALLVALSLLKKRKTTALPVSSTTTTTTTEKHRTLVQQPAY